MLSAMWPPSGVSKKDADEADAKMMTKTQIAPQKTRGIDNDESINQIMS